MNSDYPLVPLSKVLAAPLANGRSVPTAETGFPVLRLTALGNQSIDVSEYKIGLWTRNEAAPYFINHGDFLIARGNGSLDKVGRGSLVRHQPEEIAYPDTMIRVKVRRDTILPEFLALIWNSPIIRRQIESQARTTAGIYKINQTHLKNVLIPVPAINEQRFLLDVIENHLANLDAAKIELQNSSNRIRLFEQSALSQSRIGENRLLSEVAQIQGGIQKQQRRLPRNNFFPFLRVANVTARGLDTSEVHDIELFDGELARLRLQQGDLLVVEGNGSPSQIGRAALWDGSIKDCVHQNHLIRVRPLDELLPEYLEIVWNSPQNRSALTAVSSSSSGLHTLSVSKLKSLKLPVPSLQEQEEIVRDVAQIRYEARRLQVSVQAAQDYGSSLQGSLLVAALEGRFMRAHTTQAVMREVATV